MPPGHDHIWYVIAVHEPDSAAPSTVVYGCDCGKVRTSEQPRLFA